MSDDEEFLTLDANTALAQAAETLFLAAKIADKMNDTEGAMNVVAGWLEVHDRLRGVEHKHKTFGFSSVFDKTEPECDDEEELADAEAEAELEVEDGTDEG